MKYFLLLAAVLPHVSGAAQKNETVVLFNDHGISVKEKKAAILQQLLQFSDTLWEFNIYALNGPRM